MLLICLGILRISPRPDRLERIHCMALLERKEYTKVGTLMPYLQTFFGPNICPETMSYFQETDRNKTLLIYNAGGIGDIIMYSRFIRPVCESHRTVDLHQVKHAQLIRVRHRYRYAAPRLD